VPATDDSAASDAAQRLERTLRNRYLATVTYLATCRGADAALIERLLKFLDERITAQPDEGHWKQRKYELLVALDRPKELREAVTAWMNADNADSRWRLTLGYLLAELGSVPRRSRSSRESKSLTSWAAGVRGACRLVSGGQPPR